MLGLYLAIIAAFLWLGLVWCSSAPLATALGAFIACCVVLAVFAPLYLCSFFRTLHEVLWTLIKGVDELLRKLAELEVRS